MRLPHWLIARRAAQVGLLACFAGAPWIAPRWTDGTLASSLWFDRVALSDPFVVLQSWLAGHAVAATALAGAALIGLVFGLIAGRLYCGWVCPINLVTDAADALRRGIGWRRSLLPRADRRLRYGILAAVCVASAAAGTLAWEAINPIAHAVRAVAFGLWAAGAVAVVAVFLFDFVLLRHGWCGHLCPVGAFYGLIGRFGRLHVEAARASACTHCGDCFETCPVPHVISPVLRPGAAATIGSIDCLRCGRCVERCSEQVFAWQWGEQEQRSRRRDALR